ncbi:hypothetical protein HDU81_003061 [Chytriomyces hyalinus]|nr:hypothetical protein HDU81_003061 [Chytriomyces hyalinus]
MASIPTAPGSTGRNQETTTCVLQESLQHPFPFPDTPLGYSVKISAHSELGPVDSPSFSLLFQEPLVLDPRLVIPTAPASRASSSPIAGFHFDDTLEPTSVVVENAESNCTYLDIVGNAQASGRDKKRYQCLPCGKYFAYLSVLLEHQRRHSSGSKPFACTYPACEKAYTSKGRLRIHERVHTNERPFACPVAGCAYRAVQSSDLTYHSAVHLPSREKKERYLRMRPDVACLDCQAVFRSEAGLAMHKRKKPLCFLDCTETL